MEVERVGSTKDKIQVFGPLPQRLLKVCVPTSIALVTTSTAFCPNLCQLGRHHGPPPSPPTPFPRALSNVTFCEVAAPIHAAAAEGGGGAGRPLESPQAP